MYQLFNKEEKKFEDGSILIDETEAIRRNALLANAGEPFIWLDISNR